MPVCSRDCFNCIYPDCILDDGPDEQEVSQIDRIEKRYLVPSMPADEMTRAKGRAYYREHREERIAAVKAYQATHRESIAARRKIWYAENRDRILAQRRDYYARKKAKAKERG